MSNLTSIPAWIITIFAFLCLFQVRLWFEEAVEKMLHEQRHITWKGLLYTMLPNRSFIIDESLNAYGLKLNTRCLLN